MTRHPADAADTGLAVEKVCVSFAGIQALRDVSLILRPGEILGLIGANGAGKSTLVNVVSGYQRCRPGRVRLDGQDITNLEPYRRARLGLGRTFQAVRLFRRLTVRENIEAAGYGKGMRPKAARRKAAEVMELTGLAGLAESPAGALPYGDERRVAFARALASSPRYLAVDEPAAGLDERETDEFALLLSSVRAELGIAFLLIEHDVALVSRLSDRMQVLAEGRTIKVGAPDEVRRDAGVIAAYLGTRGTAQDA